VTTTVDTETQAREALQKLIAQHDLPGLDGSPYFGGGGVLVSLAQEADIEAWSRALGTAAVERWHEKPNAERRTLTITTSKALPGLVLRVSWWGTWTAVTR